MALDTGRISIDLDLPKGIRLVAIQRVWKDLWSVGLAVATEVRDPWGSSCGSIFAAARSETIAGAYEAALADIQGQLRAAQQRPKPTPKTLGPTISSPLSNLSADDIFKMLARPKL